MSDNGLIFDVKLECIIERHLKMVGSTPPASNDFNDYFYVNDPRAIKRHIAFLKTETVSLGSSIIGSNPRNAILQASIEKSFRESCSRFIYRGESVPPINPFILDVILGKIRLILDYMDKNASVISQTWIESKFISVRGLADAICDSVFYSVVWHTDEVLPLIKSLLYTNCFGNMTIFKIYNILGVLEKRKAPPQPFSSYHFHGANKKENHSWLRQTRYLRNLNKSIALPAENIYVSAQAVIDYRIPVTEAVLSSLINFIGVRTPKEKIWLRNEPCIIDIGNVTKPSANIANLRYTLESFLNDAKHAGQDIEIIRGLLAFAFPLSDKMKIEKILINGQFVEQINTKKPIGIKNPSLLNKFYRQKGFCAHSLICARRIS